MSPARTRAEMTVALGDLAFAVAAFACGLYDASWWLTGLACVGMVAYWGTSRRRVLKRLPPRVWASQTGLALSVIIAILAGAYWLGLGLAGTI